MPKHQLPYDNTIGDSTLKISQNNEVAYSENGEVVKLQLLNFEETDKLVDEFEDPDGELMYADGSIHQKYPQLKPFMP